MKKRIIAFIMAIFVVLGLCGCQDTGKAKDDKVEITMYLWDRVMSKQLTPWLEEQFPEIKFTFVVGYNTMAYYTDLTSRGAEMPDIITCRRFSINDVAHLSDKLMDLSQTEIVGTFYSNYIENNREMDGAIRWLPGCAEIDGYVANLDLFDKYDIPVPTNYDEFVRAMNAFEAVGIKGFDTDWHADYTCLETMQGCAIPELMSLEGTMWRRAYESEKEDGQVGLDDVVWPKVFEKYRQYMKDVKAVPEHYERGWNPVNSGFKNGETAIIRATANDCNSLNTVSGMNCVMLPYYGETSNDNWILTYPICQLAVAKHVEEDSAKKDAVIKVIKAIFSEEGQAALATNSAVLSYNKTVNIDLNDSLRYIKDCIESNQMYMRLASTEFFTVSSDVAKKMIVGEYTPRQAYEEFDRQLKTPKANPDDEVLITQKTAYPYTFGEHGIPSASSLINTMRIGIGDEIAIGYSSVVTSPVFEGDYTLQQLKWLMAFKSIAYRCEYTGEEVQRIMEWLVNVKEDGSNPIRHYNLMPVTSGMEYTVTDNKDGTYTLESITVNGAPLEKDRVYKVLLVGEDGYIEESLYCNCPMPQDLKDKRAMEKVQVYNSYDCMLDSIKTCDQLVEPTDYVTIK